MFYIEGVARQTFFQMPYKHDRILILLINTTDTSAFSLWQSHDQNIVMNT